MSSSPIHADFYKQFDPEQIETIFRRVFTGIHPDWKIERDYMVAMLSFRDTRQKKGPQSHAEASHKALGGGE